ncbi:Com family DNA-binding transcriptional regulator [Pseudomonas sp. LP_7_YM]|uniref:Com family DNA-binding transcriptional regulator n=1 Tax=Pseudomonas sp. LP_7_YM TaxID=2485137 RepID=UPI00105DCFD6|nr:Com family DNA-binding transcriptional regulator [Pseudomonas sp. LP_7_YM]
MLKDYRCGKCKRLLARIGEMTELQIKCARCGTLNHVRATSPELSPLSASGTASVTRLTRSTQGAQNVQ